MMDEQMSPVRIGVRWYLVSASGRGAQLTVDKSAEEDNPSDNRV